MRQKQAANAKLLEAPNRQRAGALKEHEKIRDAEAADKQANADRLKIPIPPQGTTCKGLLPDPPQTPTLNPEIFPKAGDTTAETNNPAKNIAHRADALTKQAKIIDAEEAEKANADLLKTPLHPQGPTCIGT